jgi:diacylglycerol kinase (ATP)
LLDAHGITVDSIATTGPGHAGEIARRAVDRGADLILVAGGDGTINEAVNGMVNSDVPLGILPAGTANVLATEMELGGNLERAAEKLEECRPHRISVGYVTTGNGGVSRYFLLMAGAGLDAHVAYNVSAPLKARAGKLAYWLAGWRVLGRDLPEFNVEANGVTRSCSFALLSKVRNYGGDFAIAQHVTLFDDEFEMVLFEGRSSFRYVKYMLGLMLNRLGGMKGVTVLRTAAASLSGPDNVLVYTQIDGEIAGHLPAQVRIVPDALTLLIPPEYSKRVS